MYIIYGNNILYKYVYNRLEKAYFAVTHKSEKIVSGFENKYDFYEMKIIETDTNIQDIFDVHYLIDYDTNLECVPTTWKVAASGTGYWGNTVELIFGHGLLPGWKVTDKTVSEKRVPLEDCGTIKIVYKYHVKDGVRYETPLRVEEELTKEQFKEIHEIYAENNI